MNNSTHRRHRLRWFPLALRWFTILAISSDAIGIPTMVQAAEQPNFLVVVLDDLGWTGTSVQMDPNVPFSKSDYYRTPNLERMANEGMRFSSAYSGGPVCSPSRSALLTGRTPAQVQQTIYIDEARVIDRSTYGNMAGVSPIPFHLLEEITTIPERLKQYFPEYTTAQLRKSHVGSHARNYGFDIADFHQSGFEIEGEDPAKVFAVANHANTIMESSVQDDKPFFLYVAPEAIHSPYLSTTSSFDYMDSLPRGVRHKLPVIGGMLYDADLAIGQMLDKIDQLGISDNTYVIFTTDNGAGAAPRNNEPLVGGKGFLWEGGVRVPMIVKGPGIAPGTISNVPVSGTDLFATVSELAGITAPYEPGLESASLVSLLQNGGQLPAGEALQRGYGTNGELFFHFPHYDGATTPQSAIRDGDFKLVRYYGQGGTADRLYLSNLANSLIESTSTSSPLNLVNSMPEKTAELVAKLDGWLEAVDAPMAHELAQNIHLLWDARDLNTTYPSLWRSQNKVSDLRRESWDVIPEKTVTLGPIPPEQIAQRVDIAPFQSGLGDKAFRFDGNDLMVRSFFNVSDAAHLKSDSSATFDFWFRLTNLNPNKPQVLMETGDANGGLSLTLGDADNNGKSNDLRLRVRSIGGTGYTITVPVDEFANPVDDFILATAVVNDSTDNRRIELYINGALAGTMADTPGAGNFIYWDNTDLAGLGKFAGTGIGGNGGSGNLPFSGGFDGQLAEMGFYSYALTAADIQASYNSKLSPVNAGLSAVAGQAAIPLARPTNVSLSAFQANELLVLQERSDVLDSPLMVDAVINGGVTLSNINQATPGTLPAGTPFSSYLLHFDPSSFDATAQAEGTIYFGGEILGILFDDASMGATDSILGTLGNYGELASRGLLLGPEGSLSIAADRKSLTFDLETAGNDLLQFRVLTTFVDVPTFLEADFNHSGKVNAADLAIWQDAFGSGPEGDADGDGDTDGRDFLIWQQQFIPPPPAPVFTADFNDDGFVDHDDLLVWQSSYGVNLEADANRDGTTDGRDFLIWQRELYDQSQLGLTAVPEPATFSVLFLLGLTGLSLRVRRS